MKRALRFVAAFAVAQVIAYSISDSVANPLAFKSVVEGGGPILGSFMRLPGAGEMWQHAAVWGIPAQFLRGILIALVLLPFVRVFTGWKFWKRVVTLASMHFVLTHFASSSPSGSNIEGFVYLRPELIKATFWAGQPKIIVQGLVLGLVAALLCFGRSKKKKDEAEQQPQPQPQPQPQKAT
jgi:hypothetical protein